MDLKFVFFILAEKILIYLFKKNLKLMIFNKAKIILVMLVSVFYLSMMNAVVWLLVFCSKNAPSMNIRK